MIINAKLEDIQKALNLASLQFDENLIFNNLKRLSDNRYRVTLRVRDSHGKGARLSVPMPNIWGLPVEKQRHLTSACWHAHGKFFDYLPKGTKVLTRGQKYITGTPWQDFNIGSMLYPFYASEACECER